MYSLNEGKKSRKYLNYSFLQQMNFKNIFVFFFKKTISIGEYKHMMSLEKTKLGKTDNKKHIFTGL